MRNLLITLIFFAAPALANTASTPTFPLTHCYHWLHPSYLDKKYPWAANNQGELAFFLDLTGGRGNAGAGLYCAKAPSGSADYGDRVIRIDLVEDVVVEDKVNYNKKNFCGPAVPDSECQQRKPDITYYNSGVDWFVIRTPDVIARWSTASAELVSDINADSGRNYLNSTKATNTIKLIQSDIAAKGELIFYNGKARMALNEIFSKDPNKILKMSPASVLSLLGTLKPGQSDDELLEWALESSISRILAEKDIHWADLEPIFKKNGDFRHLLIYRIRDAYFQRADKKIANTEVLLNIANLAPEELPRELMENIAANVMSDLNAPALSGFKFNSSSPMRDLFISHMDQWLTKNPPAQNLKSFAHLYKFASAQGLMSPKLTQARQNLIPQAGTNGLFLYNTGYSYTPGFPVGSDPKTFASNCEAQMILNDITQTNDLYLGPYQRKLLKLNSAGKTDPRQICTQHALVAGQLMGLMAKGSTVMIVTGDIEGLTFQFAIDSPDSLRAATADFVKTYPNLRSAQRINASVDGRYSDSNVASSGWRPDEIPEAMVNLGRYLGIITQAEKDYESSVSRNNKDYRIAAYTFGQKGRLPRIYFATDSQEEFEKDCLAAKNIYNITGIQSVKYVLNGGTYSSSVNVSSFENMCSTLRQKTSDVILSREVKEKIEKASKLPYSFQITLPGIGLFPIGVHSHDEVYSQCTSALKGIRSIPSYSKITMRDGDEYRLELDDDPPKKDANIVNSACNVVADKLFSIPSSAQLNILKRKGKYKVSVEVNARDYSFVVNDKSELRSQCLTLVPSKRTDQIYWSVPGYDNDRVFPEKNPWTTKDQICSVVVNKVKWSK